MWATLGVTLGSLCSCPAAVLSQLSFVSLPPCPALGSPGLSRDIPSRPNRGGDAVQLRLSCGKYPPTPAQQNRRHGTTPEARLAPTSRSTSGVSLSFLCPQTFPKKLTGTRVNLATAPTHLTPNSLGL